MHLRARVANYVPSFSLGFLLFLLVLICLVPSLIFAAALLRSLIQADVDAVKFHSLETARALASSVDREVQVARSVVKALSASPSLVEGRLEEFHRGARAGIDRGYEVVLTSVTGELALNTAYEFGEELPVEPAIARALVGEFIAKRGQGSDLYASPSLGDLRIAVGVPVIVDGAVFWLAVLIPTERFSSILQEQRLSPDWVTGISDRNGLTMARLPPTPQFIGRPIKSDLLTAFASEREGWAPTITREGRSVLSVFAHSESGFGVAIGIPAEHIADAGAKAFRRLVLGGLILIGGGGIIAFLAARGFRRSVATTTLAAERLGIGEMPFIDEDDSRIVELRRMNRSLRNAGSLIVRRKEDLEAAVADRTRELSQSNERLQLEMKDRLHAEEMLRQSQKIEAVGQLTAGLAHDFNNLLTVITGNLETLEEKTHRSDERLHRLAVNARRAAERAERLTGQLLAFARKQQLDPTDFDCNEILMGMDELIAKAASQSSIDLRREFAPHLSLATADRPQFEAAVLNLVVNARDAMPHGGKLTIITNNREVSADAAKLIGIAPGEYVEVTVADTGTGMTPETMARAFDPFFTTKSAGAGTGLGLSQVYGFAVQSGGGVLLESKVGEGTTIRLLLPPARGETVPRERDAALFSTSRGNPTILVVEDDADVREFAVNVITGLGYDVVEAENSERAEAILHGRGDIAAVVTDVVMPGSFDGLELAERIARRHPRIPVLVTTGYATRAQDRVRAAGAALLPKPYRASALAAAVQSLARAEGAHGARPQRASA